MMSFLLPECCADAGAPVFGLGDFWSGLGSFATSDFGKGLINAGLSIGTAFAISELGGGRRGNTGGALSGGSSVNPAGSVYNPNVAPPVIIQQPAAQTPAWLLPAAIGGGLLVLVLLLQRR